MTKKFNVGENAFLGSHDFLVNCKKLDLNALLNNLVFKTVFVSPLSEQFKKIFF